MKNSFIILVLVAFSHLAFAEEAGKFIYDSHVKRDPFIPLVGLSALPRTTGVTSINDVSLQGIARDATGKRVVIINGEMLQAGAKLDVLTVKKIKEDEVIILIGEKEYSLRLYEKEEGEKW